MVAVNAANNPEETGIALVANAATLHLNLAPYNTLGVFFQTAVNKAVYNNGHDYANEEGIKTAFDEAVAAQKSIEIAVKAINAGNAELIHYMAAGITDITADNLADVNVAVATAKAAHSSDLTKTEIQDLVDGVLEAKLQTVKHAASALIAAYYTTHSYAAVTEALALPETANAEIIAKTTRITAAISDLKKIISSFTPIHAIQAGQINNAPEIVNPLLPATVEVALADGSTRQLAVASWTDEDTYNHTISGSYTFTANVTVPDDVDLNNKSISVEVVVADGPTSITSKAITNFDFSTIQATSAKLNSKPVTVGDFTENPKSFTIVSGEDRIPVTISWKLSTDFPKGQAMGGVVDSAIQDYFYKKQGAEGIMNRTVVAFGFNDTFSISSSKSGAESSITLEGNDWEYFFEQNTSTGTNQDTSKNRTFTISDGVKTATIKFTGKFSNMTMMVNNMNGQLKRAGVLAIAEKVDDTHFKITPLLPATDIVIDGMYKTDFF